MNMIYSYKGKKPQIDENVFLAPDSVLVGDIHIKRESSIWYGATIRADENQVIIGEKTNIQEGVVIHESEESPTILGEGVTVGHKAIIHGAEIGDYTLIGMGSIILDGAKIGKNCLIGAGSLVTSGTVIDDGMLVIGSPAKVIRPLTSEQIAGLHESAESYVKRAKEYREEVR
ncbi:MAG: gamma carbonic anhydrase family protein [Cellulosilyticaceae bacterium]